MFLLNSKQITSKHTSKYVSVSVEAGLGYTQEGMQVFKGCATKDTPRQCSSSAASYHSVRPELATEQQLVPNTGRPGIS